MTKAARIEIENFAKRPIHWWDSLLRDEGLSQGIKGKWRELSVKRGLTADPETGGPAIMIDRVIDEDIFGKPLKRTDIIPLSSIERSTEWLSRQEMFDIEERAERLEMKKRYGI